MKFRYNWIPDKKDSRDYKYTKRAQEFGLLQMPSQVDLTKKCSPVENQEKIGSCTANALVGNMEFLEKMTSKVPQNLSRLFIYYNERKAEGTVNSDSGASLRDGIQVLHKAGVCDEKSWPYKTVLLYEAPNPNCYEQALSRRITKYERLSSLDDMKDCLASGFPFVFGFRVYSSFESPEVAASGFVNLPASDESFLGGHAVMAVGYDDEASRFIVRNSWGTRWGKKGYFTIPYDYLTDSKLASDFWTIQSI